MLTGAWPLEGAHQRLSVLQQGAQKDLGWRQGAGAGVVAPKSTGVPLSVCSSREFCEA